MAEKYSNEAEVMDALAIKFWRNLSKDKVIQFAAMMPKMDKKLALQVIGQLPEFTRVVGRALASIEKAYEGPLRRTMRAWPRARASSGGSQGLQSTARQRTVARRAPVCA